MSLPTQIQLDNRAKEAEKTVQTLRQSYEAFLLAWEKMMKEEGDVQKELLRHLDMAKMHSILRQIDSIS
jgi:hypothetical protein